MLLGGIDRDLPDEKPLCREQSRVQTTTAEETHTVHASYRVLSSST